MLGDCRKYVWIAAVGAIAAGLATAAPPAPPATQDAGDAQAVFESLYGAEFRKAAASAGLTDDAEVTARLLAAARQAASDPKLLEVLCQRAYQLGSQSPAAYDDAMAAMDLLAAALPQREAECWENTVTLLQRRYARTTVTFPKLEAAEHLLIVLTERADKLARAGDHAGALAVIARALPVARTIRGPHAAELMDMQRFCAGRSRFVQEAHAAEQKLQAAPDNPQVRQTAMRVYLLELDRPDKAAALLTADCDEAARTYVPLAAEDPSRVDANACLELGDWYRSQAASASSEGQVLLWRRLAALLRRARGAFPAGSASQIKASLALQTAEQALAPAEGKYPLRTVASPIAPAVLAHGRARAYLPADMQIKMFHEDLRRTNGGVDIRVSVRPDPDGQIRVVELRQVRQLRSLDALVGFALTHLAADGAARLAGDLTALAGMPLKDLDLTDCSALESLHGLEGAPLEKLSIQGCQSLKDISVLRHLPIRQLAVGDIPAVQSLDVILQLPLQSLDLGGFGQLRDLSALRGSQITSLGLERCGVETFEGVQGLKLQRLALKGCTAVTSVAALSGQVGIRQLNFAGCAGLTSLEGLQGIPLTSLSLAGCPIKGDLAVLRDARLTDLSLRGCKGLPDDLSPLKGMKLTSLDISGCTQLSTLSVLADMPLQTLTAQGCTGLAGNLTALKGCPLTELDLTGCTHLASLEGVEALKLHALDLTGCTQLKAEDYDRIARIATLRRFQGGSRELARPIYEALQGRRPKHKQDR